MTSVLHGSWLQIALYRLHPKVATRARFCYSVNFQTCLAGAGFLRGMTPIAGVLLVFDVGVHRVFPPKYKAVTPHRHDRRGS